jgi:hypothetical protein
MSPKPMAHPWLADSKAMLRALRRNDLLLTMSIPCPEVDIP